MPASLRKCARPPSHGVLVGARAPSAAHYALRDPAAVRDWLAAAGHATGNGGSGR